MNEEIDYSLQFQAKSSAELVQKYRVKIEKMQEKKKQSLTSRDAAQALGSTQIEDKMHDQRQKSLASASAAQALASTKTRDKTQSQKKQSFANISVSQALASAQIQDQTKQSLSSANIAKLSASNQVQEKMQGQKKHYFASKSVTQALASAEIQEQKNQSFFSVNASKPSASTQIQEKMQGQKKQSFASRSVTQALASAEIQVQKKQSLSSCNASKLLASNQIQEKMQDHRNKSLSSSNEAQVSGSTKNLNKMQAMEEHATKKQKATPRCPSLPLDEYIKMNEQQLELDELEDEDDEENEKEQEVEGDVNYENDDEEANNTIEGETSKRKRGRTKCLKIHARTIDDRQEIIFNEEGEPIGPNQKIVSEFSNFLGTIARSADFCPLIYTNWKAIPKEAIWAYVNKKYIIPEKGRKAVYAIINDAWRRYKCFIKRNHFNKYKNLRERLKSRPDNIPEAHFRELMLYWRLEVVQDISQQNDKNVAQLKWRHRAGPISFASIRERLRASNEDRELPTQAEMFIETRQSKKGKRLDEETNNAITKLQDLIEKEGQSSTDAFQTMFGKEKPGRVRCYGRTTTPTILKKNTEIAEIEKRHADEVKHLNDKVQGMEAEHAEMKAKHAEKTMLNQGNSGMNVEALVALLSTPGDANSGLRSSTSTHAPNDDEIDEEPLLDNLDDVEDDDMLR